MRSTKCCSIKPIINFFLLAIAPIISSPALAQTNAPAATELATDEKDACARNLNKIYEAIQAFQNDHHDLPNWLSDLVPQYISDTNLLICPVCGRTGKTEQAALADPKIPSCCYLFEFCPLPLGNTAPKAPTRTRREWKRRQMGLVGSMVPIVRCRQHGVALNLAFDGRIYESPLTWEKMLTNRVSPDELTAARLFANEPPLPSDGRGIKGEGPRIPPRDPKTPKELLDLSRFYNAALSNSWHGGTGNDLSAFPAGKQTLEDTEFDARGIVQLGGKSPSAAKFPTRITGIEVHQKCQQFYFLHAAGFGAVGDEGKLIGSFTVHFASNQLSVDIPIFYGRDVRNWHVLADEPPAPPELKAAWTGQNAITKRSGRSLRLFITSWTNLAPDMEIESLDYVSSMANPAPFLLAITAVPATFGVPPLGGSVSSAQIPPAAPLFSKSILALLFSVPIVFVAFVVWLLLRRRHRPSMALIPMSGGPGQQALAYPLGMMPQAGGMLLSETTSVSIPSGALESMAPAEEAMWRQRALAAEERARLAAAMAQKEIAPGLNRWLKSKLLGKLLTDRASLLQTQEAAASKVLEVDERLNRIELQLQEQNQSYERRIEELTRELLAAKEENRELIRIQIAQVKAEMEAARAKLLAQAEATTPQTS